MLRLVWSVHALQSGDGDKARRYLSFPPSAEAARLGDPEYVFPWNLETIVNELLATTKVERRPDRRERHLRGDRFDTIRELTNAVRALENAEDGMSLKKRDVFVELHRGFQRQFEWQRDSSTVRSLPVRAAVWWTRGQRVLRGPDWPLHF
jgi:hypothetical protein